MRITDYTVVSENQIEALVQNVRKLLKDGYEPLGGIQVVAPVVDGGVAPAYVQSIIKKVE